MNGTIQKIDPRRTSFLCESGTGNYKLLDIHFPAASTLEIYSAPATTKIHGSSQHLLCWELMSGSIILSIYRSRLPVLRQSLLPLSPRSVRANLAQRHISSDLLFINCPNPRRAPLLGFETICTEPVNSSKILPHQRGKRSLSRTSPRRTLGNAPSSPRVPSPNTYCFP